MPNDETVSIRWRTYLTTVDEIEKTTGYDFLSAVPKKTQAVIEAKVDTESETRTVETKKAETKPSNTRATKKTEAGGERVYIKGSGGGCYYMGGDKKIYVKNKSLCGL